MLLYRMNEVHTAIKSVFTAHFIISFAKKVDLTPWFFLRSPTLWYFRPSSKTLWSYFYYCIGGSTSHFHFKTSTNTLKMKKTQQHTFLSMVNNSFLIDSCIRDYIHILWNNRIVCLIYKVVFVQTFTWLDVKSS